MKTKAYWPILAVIAALGLAAPIQANDLTTLHSFGGASATPPDGAGPYLGDLIADASGAFYGTTSYGGAYNLGTVFMLSPDSAGGWTETVLHSFSGGADGSGPQAGLTADASGALYGTTTGAGGTTNVGTVFKL